MTRLNGKRPESVLVVVYTAAGEVLLLRRCEPEGFWQSVTGSLRWGESPAEAARRELCEETALVADDELRDRNTSNRYPIHPAWRARYAPDVIENLEHVFTLALAAAGTLTLAAHEHAEYVWLPRAAALDRVSSASNRAAIARFVP